MQRHEFLYDITFWEVRRIIRGYNRRCKDMWSAFRWSTYNIMAAQVGGEQLSKNGINGPKALLELPWDVDDENDNIPTDEEVDKLQKEMNSINAQL